MVDKTKRALTILQQRSTSSNGIYQHSPTTSKPDLPSETLRKPMNELIAATIRSTEERVVEVRRRAEEAVMEVRRPAATNRSTGIYPTFEQVKRTAMAEIQKAVSLAEQRALQADRVKMERLLIQATKGKVDATDHHLRPKSEDELRNSSSEGQVIKWMLEHESSKKHSL